MFRMAKRSAIVLVVAVVAAWFAGNAPRAASGRLDPPANAVASDLHAGGAQSGFASRLLVVRGREQSSSWRYRMRFIDGTPITLTIPKGFPGARRVLVGYELGPFA